MAYSSGILDKRMTILNQSEATNGKFGRTGGLYIPVQTVWAAVDWARGTKAMREGALDAYDSIMVRCRYHQLLSRASRISIDNKIYQIDSFHADQKENSTQITATEIVNT